MSTEKPIRKPRSNAYVATTKNKNLVKNHVMVGTPQEIIADIIGITSKTLRKYYREELDQAVAIANSAIGGVLFRKAMKGDTAALIFWAKTRAGFREPRDEDNTAAQAISINIVNPNAPN